MIARHSSHSSQGRTPPNQPCRHSGTPRSIQTHFAPIGSTTSAPVGCIHSNWFRVGIAALFWSSGLTKSPAGTHDRAVSGRGHGTLRAPNDCRG